ncbi:hypothetical protein AB0L99_22640 [Streptomyces sp. NPDC051954]|uniref:hypothetical protein n=1 Tax=unclassified Streptomyces TaxID=2593676 RepID=UPI00341F827A
MGRRAMSALTAATIMLGVLAGCRGGSDQGAAGEQVRNLTPAEELRISDAEQLLIKRCMNRAGFRYWTWHVLSAAERRPIGYVQDDVAWAREHGYGSRIAAKSEWGRKHNPNGAYRGSLPVARGKAYDAALDGGPGTPVLTAEVPGGGTIHRRAGGCVSEAQKQLYGDLDTWFHADKVADNLRPLYVPEVMRDKRFGEALRAWSACMRRAGHHHADPGRAREAATKRGFATETEIAAADAACARETSLKTVGKAREAYYVEKLTADYGEELATHRRLRWEALARAEKLVGPRR